MNAIEVENLYKNFRIYHERSGNLKYYFVNFFKGKRDSYEDFWALQDVSFTVKRGEMLGVIGQNGSGKSTLLKVLSKILYPDKGSVVIKDKVAALFGLGLGFNPELTGEKNIHLSASILGLTRKYVDKSLDDIIEFSGLRKFIDTPIKNYSYGMQMRLAFAVAVNVNPDILLLDEILSVGDEAFQAKCMEKMKGFKRQGKTIVLVSHVLNTVEEMCDKAILLQKGKIFAEGKPFEVIKEYRRLLQEKSVII